MIPSYFKGGNNVVNFSKIKFYVNGYAIILNFLIVLKNKWVYFKIYPFILELYYFFNM